MHVKKKKKKKKKIYYLPESGAAMLFGLLVGGVVSLFGDSESELKKKIKNTKTILFNFKTPSVKKKNHSPHQSI